MYEGIYKDQRDAVCPDYTTLNWAPHKHQGKVLYDSSPARIVRACRQSGKTELIAVEALLSAIRGKDVLIVGHCPSATGMIFLRIERLLGDAQVGHISHVYTQPYHRMHLSVGGSTVCIKGFSPADSAALCGQRTDVLLCDEADFYSPGLLTQAMATVRPKKSSRILLVSTPALRLQTDPPSEFRLLYESGNYTTFHWPYTVAGQDRMADFQQDYLSEYWQTDALAEWV